SIYRQHRKIKCNYLGRKWLALRLSYYSNAWNNMLFYGRAYSDTARSQYMLKEISIYNHQNKTKLNSEIYDSMQNYTTNREFFKNGKKVWHTGNDGSGSGLDADLLDGKHASTIISEAIAGVTAPKPFTKGSNTNGKWIKFSDGTIIAERKVTVTYTHNQKIPNFAYNMPVSMPTDSYVGVSLRSVYTANSEAEIDIYDNFDFLVVGKRGNQWIMKPNLFNRYGSVSYGANNGNWFNTK